MTLEEIEAAAELMHDTFGHLDENGFHDMLAYAKAMMDNRHERRRAMAMKPRCICAECLRDPPEKRVRKLWILDRVTDRDLRRGVLPSRHRQIEAGALRFPPKNAATFVSAERCRKFGTISRPAGRIRNTKLAEIVPPTV